MLLQKFCYTRQIWKIKQNEWKMHDIDVLWCHRVFLFCVVCQNCQLMNFHCVRGVCVKTHYLIQYETDLNDHHCDFPCQSNAQTNSLHADTRTNWYLKIRLILNFKCPMNWILARQHGAARLISSSMYSNTSIASNNCIKAHNKPPSLVWVYSAHSNVHHIKS